MVKNLNDASTTVMLTSGASGRVRSLLSLRLLRSLWLLMSTFFLIFLLPFRGRRWSMPVGAAPELSDKGGGKEAKVVRVPAAMVPRKSAAAAEGKEAVARRTIAIKRVMEDCDGRTAREFSLFVTARGDTMFTQSWAPVSVPVRGLVILLHGLNEHSGRYNDFAKKLNANGYKVYGMDWIGVVGGRWCLKVSWEARHPKTWRERWSPCKMFLSKVLTENPKVPCFCFGHSTGGSIILKGVLDPKIRQQIAGVVMTSPAIGVQPSHPIFSVLAPIMSFLLPRFQFPAANKNGIAVSRDAVALVDKYSDPLVFTGSIRVRTGYEILRITTYLRQNLSRLTVPFLVLHGTADSVTDPDASRKLYKEASSTDKTINLYDGLLHDLLIEPEKEEIMHTILAWLNSRL